MILNLNKVRSSEMMGVNVNMAMENFQMVHRPNQQVTDNIASATTSKKRSMKLKLQFIIYLG